MVTFHPKVPLSCKGCGARRTGSNAKGNAEYKCGFAEFVITDTATGQGSWGITPHSIVGAHPIPDDSWFKINLNIHAATSEDEVILVVEEWSRNEEVRLSGWVHKRRCVSVNSNGNVQWEIRFYGNFLDKHASQMKLVHQLGLYLAMFYEQKEFRFTDKRRTYKVEIPDNQPAIHA